MQIIGTGPDEETYKNIINSQNITQVEMTGYKHPLEYYKKASIISVTSANEGWGMVITEAMQMGVVPIVMDSFESLTDIIDDNINGYIIPNNDIDIYTRKLLYLMNNPIVINNMAKQSIKKSHNFSINNMVNKWNKLITNDNG